MCKCLICDKEVKNRKGLSIHLKNHKIKLLDYYIKYEEFEIPRCPYCKEECYTRSCMVFNKTCGNKECKSKILKTKIISNESKKKISEKRKIWLKENPDKHNWKKLDKFKSIPCEKFKQTLIENNISFIDEFTPLDSTRYFSIDIVILDKKIGLEINGNQHYNRDGTLKEYYQNRNEHLKSLGWYLIEIPYYKVYDSIFIEKIINFINNYDVVLDKVELLKEYEEHKMYVKTRYVCSLCNGEKYKTSKICINCARKNPQKNSGKFQFRSGKRKVERPSYEQLKKELEKGSYLKLGIKYGVSGNAVKKWLILYEKELGIYKEDKCTNIGKYHSEETKRRIGQSNKKYSGRKWIHNNDENKIIFITEIDEYLSQGWEIGINKEFKN